MRYLLRPTLILLFLFSAGLRAELPTATVCPDCPDETNDQIIAEQEAEMSILFDQAGAVGLLDVTTQTATVIPAPTP